jgi:hypothetical protein
MSEVSGGNANHPVRSRPITAWAVPAVACPQRSILRASKAATLSIVLTAGQAGDSPQFTAVLEAIRVARTGPGRPRSRPDTVLADKAYSSRANLRRASSPPTRARRAPCR